MQYTKWWRQFNDSIDRCENRCSQFNLMFASPAIYKRVKSTKNESNARFTSEYVHCTQYTVHKYRSLTITMTTNAYYTQHIYWSPCQWFTHWPKTPSKNTPTNTRHLCEARWMLFRLFHKENNANGMCCVCFGLFSSPISLPLNQPHVNNAPHTHTYTFAQLIDLHGQPQWY